MTTASKLKITPGEWSFEVDVGQVRAITKQGPVTIANVRGWEDRWRDEEWRNGKFIAEAGTVANETGLMPREMKEQRDELRTELMRACVWLRYVDGEFEETKSQLATWRALLARVEGRAS